MTTSFAALATTSELSSIFARYPPLRAYLQKIYQATVEPTDEDGEAFQSSRSSGWTVEKGTRTALYRLTQSQAYGELSSEGMNEFRRLVVGRCTEEGKG